MIRDYAKGMNPEPPKSRKVPVRTKYPAPPDGIKKFVGFMVVMFTVLGLVVVMWMGQEIRRSLHELSENRKVQEGYTQTHKKLLAERDQLMELTKIELAAMEIGLYRPDIRQLMRP